MTSLLIGVVVALVVAVAALAAVVRDVLAAVVVFAAYSLGMAVLWLALLAPDVALTEAAVGAGVTTSLFVAALLQTRRPESDAASVGDVDPKAVLPVVALVAMLLATVPSLPAVGSASAPPFQRVSPYYLDRAVAELGVPNAVTAVLAGYRAFDTFGEITVVFAAGVAVLVVFRREVI